MAIGKPHRRAIDHMVAAAAIERRRRNQHILDLAAIGAGVHAQPAADRAGDAGEEFEPGDPGLGRGQRHIEVERRRRRPRSRSRSMARPANPRPRRIVTPGIPPSRTSRLEPPPITVTGSRGRQRREKGGEIVDIGGPEQHFRRAADAEPGLPPDRRVRGQPAAHRRQRERSALAAESGRGAIIRRGSALPSAASSPGRLLAQR